MFADGNQDVGLERSHGVCGDVGVAALGGVVQVDLDFAGNRTHACHGLRGLLDGAPFGVGGDSAGERHHAVLHADGDVARIEARIPIELGLYIVSELHIGFHNRSSDRSAPVGDVKKSRRV